MKSLKVLPCAVFALMMLYLPWNAYSDGTSEGEEPAAPSANVLESFLFRGNMSASYRFRHSTHPDEPWNDHDLAQELQLNLSSTRGKSVEASFTGSLREDLDGNSGRTDFYAFEDIGDTTLSPVFLTVYEAQVDVKDPFPYLARFRMGRQSGYRNEPVLFDGFSLDFTPSPMLLITLYGGASVHLFEVAYSWGSDLTAGAGVDFSPAANIMVSADYLFIKDTLSVPPESLRFEHLLTLSSRMRFFSFLKTTVKLRLINWAFRDSSLSTIFTFPGIDLQFSAVYAVKFGRREEFSHEFAPYSLFLGESLPYHSIDGKVRKLLGRHVAMDMGFFRRGLLYPEETDPFNRKYSRMYTVIELSDVFLKGIFFSVSGDITLIEKKQNYSAGMEAGYVVQRSVMKDMRIHTGAYFNYYTYDDFLEPDAEETVPTVFVKVKVPVGKSFYFRGKYEYEKAIDSYNTLKLETVYEF